MCVYVSCVSDGRGPLFWAHEANNEEAIELLKKAGADMEEGDADGKTCTDFEHGKMTEYMVSAVVGALGGVSSLRCCAYVFMSIDLSGK